jgi:DNA-binding transcriptional ArsR family regulator
MIRRGAARPPVAGNERMAGVSGVFRALSNPNRLKVYQTICRAAAKSRKGITIEQICAALRMKQPAVSHHVAHLAGAGLVDRVKDRWWVHCTPSAEAIALLSRFAKDPAGFDGA